MSVNWPETIHGRVLRIQSACLTAFDEALSRGLSEKRDTSLLQKVRSSVSASLQYLTDSIPASDEAEVDYLLMSSKAVSYVTLRENYAKCQTSLREARSQLIEVRQENALYCGKLKKRDEVLSYIRKTLWHEVCLLREQLYARDHKGDFDQNVFSIFDFCQLVEDESDNPENIVSAMDKLRRDFEQDKIDAAARHAEDVAVLHATITSLKSDLEYIKQQRVKKAQENKRDFMVQCWPLMRSQENQTEGFVRNVASSEHERGVQTDPISIGNSEEEIVKLKEKLTQAKNSMEEWADREESLRNVIHDNEAQIVALLKQHDKESEKITLLERLLQQTRDENVNLHKQVTALESQLSEAKARRSSVAKKPLTINSVKYVQTISVTSESVGTTTADLVTVDYDSIIETLQYERDKLIADLTEKDNRLAHLTTVLDELHQQPIPITETPRDIAIPSNIRPLDETILCDTDAQTDVGGVDEDIFRQNDQTSTMEIPDSQLLLEEIEKLKADVLSQVKLREDMQRDMAVMNKQLMWKSEEASQLTSKLVAIANTHEDLKNEIDVLATPSPVTLPTAVCPVRVIVVVDWSDWRRERGIMNMTTAVKWNQTIVREITREVHEFHGKPSGDVEKDATHIVVCFEDALLSLQWVMFLLRSLVFVPEVQEGAPPGAKRPFKMKIGVSKGEIACEITERGTVGYYGSTVTMAMALADASILSSATISFDVAEDSDIENAIVSKLLDHPICMKMKVKKIDGKEMVAFRLTSPVPESKSMVVVGRTRGITTAQAPSPLATSTLSQISLKHVPTHLSYSAKLQYELAHTTRQQPIQQQTATEVKFGRRMTTFDDGPEHDDTDLVRESSKGGTTVKRAWVEAFTQMEGDDFAHTFRHSSENAEDVRLLKEINISLTQEVERLRPMESALAEAQTSAKNEQRKANEVSALLDELMKSQDMTSTAQEGGNGFSEASKAQYIKQIASLSERLFRALTKAPTLDQDVQCNIQNRLTSTLLKPTSYTPHMVVCESRETAIDDLSLRFSRNAVVGDHTAIPIVKDMEIQCELLLPCVKCSQIRTPMKMSTCDIMNPSPELHRPRSGSVRKPVVKGFQMHLASPTAKPDTSNLVPPNARSMLPQTSVVLRPSSSHASSHMKVVERAKHFVDEINLAPVAQGLADRSKAALVAGTYVQVHSLPKPIPLALTAPPPKDPSDDEDDFIYRDAPPSPSTTESSITLDSRIVNTLEVGSRTGTGVRGVREKVRRCVNVENFLNTMSIGRSMTPGTPIDESFSSMTISRVSRTPNSKSLKQ